jgi:hypothetical protein
MDPASIVGLVAAGVQFVDFAYKTLKALSHLCHEIAEAPVEASELQYEISSTVGVVTSLKFLLDTAPKCVSSSEEGTLNDSLTSAIKITREMLERLEKGISASQKKKLHRLIWPFKKREVTEYVEKIQRYKGTIQLALQVNQTYRTWNEWRTKE